MKSKHKISKNTFHEPIECWKNLCKMINCPKNVKKIQRLYFERTKVCGILKFIPYVNERIHSAVFHNNGKNSRKNHLPHGRIQSNKISNIVLFCMCMQMHSCCKYILYFTLSKFLHYSLSLSFVLFALECVRLSVCDELVVLCCLLAVVIFYIMLWYTNSHRHTNTNVLVRCELVFRLLYPVSRLHICVCLSVYCDIFSACLH